MTTLMTLSFLTWLSFTTKCVCLYVTRQESCSLDCLQENFIHKTMINILKQETMRGKKRQFRDFSSWLFAVTTTDYKKQYFWWRSPFLCVFLGNVACFSYFFLLLSMLSMIKQDRSDKLWRLKDMKWTLGNPGGHKNKWIQYKKGQFDLPLMIPV